MLIVVFSPPYHLIVYNYIYIIHTTTKHIYSINIYIYIYTTYLYIYTTISQRPNHNHSLPYRIAPGVRWPQNSPFMGPEWDWYWVLIINIYIWLIPNINPIQATKYGCIMINGIHYMDLYCWLVVWKMNFYDFPYIGDSNPNWLSYFSEGLKPPTRLGKYPQIWVSIYHLMTVYHSLQPILTTWIQPLLQCGASQWCHKSYFLPFPNQWFMTLFYPHSWIMF